MANDSGFEETWSDWDEGGQGLALGALVTSALVAGAVAYLIRRRRQGEEKPLETVSSRAAEAAALLAGMGDDRVAAGREFLAEKVLPEFKPALLAILQEVQGVVDQAFRRAERAIEQL